jgi:enoyl-CoA hydratase/carnithine racemase
MIETTMQPFVRYETPAPAIARVVLTRPNKANAINPRMIYQINAAFDRAARDDEIKVIILAAEGKHFSAGHDLAETLEQFQASIAQEAGKVSTWSGFEDSAAYGLYASEREAYFETARRWRNIPKPLIAAVQGKCIGGALIFIWVCDIIVAGRSASFADPVVDFGMNGVAWFAHPWELGPRKAKEFLFTSDSWSAAEARSLGMVNHVVADEELAQFALIMAEKIANKPMFALKLSKETVNRTLDIQGHSNAMDAAFSLHHLSLNQNIRKFGSGIDPTNLPAMVNAPKGAPRPSGDAQSE